jgi:hypothetical protein
MRAAIDRAIATGERQPIVDDDGNVNGWVSVPNTPLAPGWCCEEHEEKVVEEIAQWLREKGQPVLAAELARVRSKDAPAALR